MSKHEEILAYIEELEIGKRVSVRGISNRLNVADGTAYRAIKEAELRGLVAINDRSGTVRVASKGQKVANRFTFGKLAEIADADILGGLAGIGVEFSHFTIAAMEISSVKKYLVRNGLVIVGDRKDIQHLALKEQNAVLVTGGFDVDDEVINYANALGIPILRTSYDTFTVANRISHALSNELIKKDIVTIGELVHHRRQTLREEDTVKRFYDLAKKTNLNRFAVLNWHRIVVGVISLRDVNNHPNDTPINKLMTKPTVAKSEMTVATVSQKMVFEGYEMMPVVYPDFTYAGVITKSDLLQSLQKSQEESQVGRTFSEEISSFIKEKSSAYVVTVEPLMINNVGSLAIGALTELIGQVVRRLMNKTRKRNIVIEGLNINVLGAISIDNVLEIYPKIISNTRLGVIVDCEIYHINNIVAKVLVSVQVD